MKRLRTEHASKEDLHEKNKIQVATFSLNAIAFNSNIKKLKWCYFSYHYTKVLGKKYCKNF